MNAKAKDEIILSLMAAPRNTIRDTVWGDIPLFEKEIALIDSRAFQRLRRVQQLAFTSWVFPGAHHTRFEHCLGVMHLTRQAILHLMHLPMPPALTLEDANTVIAAAMLHDIGHYPFSHAVEELDLSIIRDHEEIGQTLVTGPEIAPILEQQWGVKPERVARLIGRADGLAPRDRLLHDLFSGALDTDKLDYLSRDSKYCNVPYGIVDVQRLLSSLRVWPVVAPDASAQVQQPMTTDDVGKVAQPGDGDRFVQRLTLDEKGVGALQSLIFARYLMFYNVYWHHTNRIATVMFLRALQEALESNAFSATQLEQSDDASVMALIENTTGAESAAHELITELKLRRLYKRALSLQEDDPLFARLAPLKYNSQRRKRLEAHWAARLAEITGVATRGHDVLLDIPEGKSFEMVLGVVCDKPPNGWQNPVPWGEVSGLDNDDMRKFHRRVRRIQIVTRTQQLADAFDAHAATLLNAYREVE